MSLRSLLVAAPLLLLTAVLIAKITVIHPFILLAFFFCIVIAIATLRNPINGLFIIVFSMLLSPEIQLANVPGRPVTVRVDDLMIIVMFVAWMTYTALNKDWKGFIKTPLDPYLGILTALYVLSTGAWIVAGNVYYLKGFFYTLKYIQYFVLYWMVANAVTHREDLRRFFIAALLTAAVVTIYGYSLFGSEERVFAPFDTGGGEPASLGGYYLILFSVMTAFVLHTASVRCRLLCSGLMLFMLPVFVKTLSRASYIALLPLLLTILFLTRRHRLLFGAILLSGTLLFPLLAPGLYHDAVARISATFTSGHAESMAKYQVGSGSHRITDQSALERISSWRMVMNEKFNRNIFTVLFGNGVTGIGFVEGQLFLMLGEVGLVGALIFYLLLFKIARQGYRIYRSTEDVVSQSLSLGLVAALIGLIVQSLTTNTFIIVRIMEPFWFLAGIVMVLPTLKEQSLSPELRP